MVPSFLCVRHGHESMRLKSSVHELQNHEVMVTKVQAEGKGIIAKEPVECLEDLTDEVSLIV